MASKRPETRIGVGETDGFRYLGVTPPFSPDERRLMSALSGIVADMHIIDQVDRSLPRASVVMVASELDVLTPEGMTHRAQVLGRALAVILRNTRGHIVRFDPAPIELNGTDNNPFDPITRP